MSDWTPETSHCPYDPGSPFGKTIAKLCSLSGVSQADIDALEGVARERTALLLQVKSLEADVNLWRTLYRDSRVTRAPALAEEG